MRRLCQLRWWWLGLALLFTALMPRLLGLALPWPAMLAILGLTAAINLLTMWRLRRGVRTDALGVFLQLLIDLIAFSALLFFSGGATNPLISLLLPLVAMAALTLPLPYVTATAIAAVAAYSTLMVTYIPLPLNDPIRAARLHLAGMWLTFAFSAVLMAWLLLRAMHQIRHRDTALAAAREQALREERVVAIGALAAGAAHELGTPLATMHLLAGELEHEPGLSAEGRADLEILREQIRQCKQILTTLSSRAGAERAESLTRMPLDLWLQEIRERWRNLRPGAECRLQIGEGTVPPVLIDQTLEQALLNFLNNAARAARHEIVLTAEWNSEQWSIEVRDDGPGFPDEVLALAGREALPAHADGSGIGILLSVTAVERLGGRVRLYNPPAGGAVVRLEFPINA